MRFSICIALLVTEALACNEHGKAPREASAPLVKEAPAPSERPTAAQQTTARLAKKADTELPAPVMVDLETVTWRPGPAALPKGARMAVLEGAPPFPAGKTFSLLLELPAGYAIPPHTHPATERVTVLQGRFNLGHGAAMDEEAATVVEPGGLITLPAGHIHYAFTRDEPAIVLLQGVGPWDVFYVDRADDRRRQPPDKPRITKSPLEAADRAKIIAAKDIEFTEPPPGMLPDGAKIAVLEGDPDQPKTFVIRLKFPDGYRVPVHTHSTSDRFAVVQGELMFAIGSRPDHQAFRSFGSGSVIIVPKGIEHYAAAHGETVIQVFGVGPFDIIWSDLAAVPRS